MNSNRPSRLRFNFGFLLEADLGTSRTFELDYPTIHISQDVTLAPLKGTFTATRTSEGVYISGPLYSAIQIECVRCLTDILHPVSLQLDEMYYYPPSVTSDREQFIGDTGYIDLSPLVRQLALLEVPMQPICGPNCQGLCMVCGQNLNKATCDCQEDDIDPRLAILKTLLD